MMTRISNKFKSIGMKSMISLLTGASFLLLSFNYECNKIEDGRYRVHFITKGYEDYELLIVNNQFTKILKDGNSKKGKLEWRDNCILVLNEETESKKEHIINEIEAGLGKECIQFGPKKGSTIYFKTTRTTNFNIIINEGKFIKLKR